MVTWLREISRDADAALRSDVQQTCQNLDKESIPQDNRCSGVLRLASTNVHPPMRRQLVHRSRGRPSDILVRGRRSLERSLTRVRQLWPCDTGWGLSSTRTSRLLGAASPVCAAGSWRVSLSPAVPSFNGGVSGWLIT